MTKLKIYNFLTRKKEVFRPVNKNLVGFYACGPTVYDYAHIGNLRAYIFEDVLRRALEYGGYKVKHVMNITDIDDKIVRDFGSDIKAIKVSTKNYEAAFYKDLNSLNIKRAWKYPRATEHIKKMIDLIKILIKKKLAYKTTDGVFFDIAKFKKYGKLSQLKKREIKTGARVASDEYKKKNARDFVLWKTKKPKEPFWPSPFGPGRPGWHLECSAMSMKYLGESFDIHAGGVDLLFPHHENEIAQSEGATGKKFVKYFVEGEHLLVDSKKMSKSLGNIFTLRDLEKRNFNPLAFRYLALSAHYRSWLNFTWKSLEAAQVALDRLFEFVSNQKLASENRLSLPSQTRARAHAYDFHLRVSNFKNAISDDLDTPKALAVMWQLIKDYNKSANWRTQKYATKEVLGALYKFDEVLGLGFKNLKAESPSEAALKLLKEREKARKTGDFKKADEIREKIRHLGWQVNDTVGGSQLFHI